MADESIGNAMSLGDTSASGIRAVADEFSVACRAGQRPRLEDFLQRVPAGAQELLLEVLIGREVEHRRGCGEAVSSAEYEMRFPSWKDLIQRAFARMREMERPPGAGTRWPEHSDPGDTSEHGSSGITTTEVISAKRAIGVSPRRASRDDRPQPEEGVGDQPVWSEPPAVLAGRYAIRHLLGRGRFGQVYLADDLQLCRPVAIKVPGDGCFDRQQVGERFLREARAAAMLKHPAIVSVHDVVTDTDGRCFVVMDYIAGRTLREVIRGERLDPIQIATLLATVARGLHQAHKQGLVHRDLKPANILLDSECRPHIADFGLAVHEETQREFRGERAGTPTYMAPEQVRGESHVLDGRTDIWAVGVMLYEMLSGRRPFEGKRDELFREITEWQPKPPRQINDAIPVVLEQICLKCLSKSCENRYTTAADLAVALEQFAQSVRPDPARAVAHRGALRRRWMVIAAITICVGLLTIIVALRVPLWLARAASFPADARPDRGSGVDGARLRVVATETGVSPRAGPPGALLPMTPAHVVQDREQSTPPPARVINGTRLAQLHGHTGAVRCLVFSTPGNLLATGSDDQTIRLWDSTSWGARRVIGGLNNPVACLAFSPQGDLLAWGTGSYYDMTVHVWRIATEEDVMTCSWSEPNSPSQLHSLVFSPDGSLLAAGGSGPVRVWQLPNPVERHVFQWQQTFPSYVYGVAFSPHGKTLAAGCHGGGAPAQADVVRLWDLQAGAGREILVGQENAFGLSHERVDAALTFSPDGKQLWRATRGVLNLLRPSGTLVVWSLDQNFARVSHEIPGGNTYALCVAPRGETFVAVAEGPLNQHLAFPGSRNQTDSGSISLWSATTRQTTILRSENAGRILALAFSPDGTRLASASDDNSISIWNLDAVLAQRRD